MVAMNALASSGPTPGTAINRRRVLSHARLSGRAGHFRGFGPSPRQAAPRAFASKDAHRRTHAYLSHPQDGKKLIDTAPPDGSDNAELREMRRIELESWVRWRLSINLTRCSIITLCCSVVLMGTKRIVGRATASQIASASAASFFPRFT